MMTIITKLKARLYTSSLVRRARGGMFSFSSLAMANKNHSSRRRITTPTRLEAEIFASGIFSSQKRAKKTTQRKVAFYPWGKRLPRAVSGRVLSPVLLKSTGVEGREFAGEMSEMGTVSQMKENFPIKKERLKYAWTRLHTDAGPWFLFIFCIYCILVIKVVTYRSFADDIFFGVYSLLITCYIFSRFLFSFFHKAVQFDLNYQPSITFVVPAKNEEDNIIETIRRFRQVDYPHELIEVIAINDGSDDNTVGRMYEAQREIAPYVARVEVVDWKVNRGKRQGMAEGVKRSRHDIVIFVDSDSFIAPDCVKHLVKYFINPKVGAVSGHTDVCSRDTNLLTMMRAIRYYIAFTVYKAAESVFGNVTCCPGCCSAYRRSYLNEFLDDWLYQKFLGEECTFGDDRSLTNYMIRKYHAVYSEEAKAHTVVPDSFGKYMRQQQRWKKSWVRESLIASFFMWKKHPLAAISFYTYIFLAFASPIVFFRAMLWHPIVGGQLPAAYLLGLLLMLLLHGLYYRIKVGPKAWFLAIISFWFNTVLLMWQLPWAIITIRDSRWGTR